MEYFNGIATILTGAIAWFVYWLKKKNEKVQAARVLLTEIRIAEVNIEKIKDKIDDGKSLDLPLVFPTRNWKKYAHLFISDFDQDELRMINSFYDYGEAIEDSIKRDDNYFWITAEERGRVMVQKLAKFIDESFDQDAENRDKYVKDKRDYLSIGFDEYNIPYYPKRTFDYINKCLPKIKNITTSSCGVKLKKIAKLNK
ncbi:hypothetical protein ACFL08_03150 [Patescibacteria group bacterium]